MTNPPTPEELRDAPPIPYATPQPARKSEEPQTLGMVVLFLGAASVGIFFVAGAAWPAAAAVVALAAVAIAFGHFLTRGPR